MKATMKSPQDEDFAALLKEFDGKGAKRGARVGDAVRGRVVSFGRDSAFVELSDGMGDGMIELAQLRDREGALTAQVGDEIEARVVESMGKSGCVILRKSAVARGPEAKAELQQAFELGLPVEGSVTGVNKGGVEVLVAGVRAFCPISQLEMRHVEDASVYVGRKLEFRITRYEVDNRGDNLVVSRRALLEAEARSRAEKIRGKLVAGAILPGVVVALKDFGAFIDLGGVEGMLPASELGFSRGVRPADKLSLGQHLDVQILRIEKTDDPKRPERISLSLKALERDPWEDVAARFPSGTKVSGRITRVEAFGAFVELAPGIEGLVHIGELSGGKQVRNPRELAKVGATLDVTVLALDRERRRISLGIGDRADVVSQEDLDAARAPARLGTLADLFKKKL
jgi:small subunit ribosomal protein S1